MPIAPLFAFFRASKAIFVDGDVLHPAINKALKKLIMFL